MSVGLETGKGMLSLEHLGRAASSSRALRPEIHMHSLVASRQFLSFESACALALRVRTTVTNLRRHTVIKAQRVCRSCGRPWKRHKTM